MKLKNMTSIRSLTYIVINFIRKDGDMRMVSKPISQKIKTVGLV